jgi:hypothetical protein
LITNVGTTVTGVTGTNVTGTLVESLVQALVELDAVQAALGPSLTVEVVEVEVDGDAALAVYARPARAVDLHPLVQKGGGLMFNVNL